MNVLQLALDFSEPELRRGKPLVEFRIEIELGLGVYVLPDGYCVFWKNAQGTYIYSACTDETWNTWDEMIAENREFASQPSCSTYSPEVTKRIWSGECHWSWETQYD